MKILVSELPRSDWWGKGMPHHKNNWLTDVGSHPNPTQVRDSHARFVAALKEIADIVLIPFPEEFESDRLYKHDFIFVRDSYICAGPQDVIISNFSERSRQDEALYMKTFLSSLGKRIHTLSDDAYAEGGEFSILYKDHLMFSGVNRSNEKGVTEVARILGIQDVCIVRTNAFHLDTNFSVLLSTEGICVGVLACVSAIVNMEEVNEFCARHSIPLIALDAVDGIGSPKFPGTFAANSLPIPGVLVSGAYFSTKGAEERIASLGIRRVVVPLGDLNLSGGSVHCLTNELEG